jgi:hypothetical protein
MGLRYANATEKPPMTDDMMNLRKVADQLRPKLLSSPPFPDEAETDVLAYMTFAPASDQAALDQPDRAPQRRDQATDRVGRHLPQRRRHRSPHRSGPARAEQ